MLHLASQERMMACGIDQLFQYTINMENYSLWFPGIQEVVSKNSMSHEVVGKQYEESLVLPTGESALTIEVVSVEHNRLFMTHGDLQPLMPMMIMRFTPIDEERSLFSLSYYCRNETLEGSDFLDDLRADLQERSAAALEKLQSLIC